MPTKLDQVMAEWQSASLEIEELLRQTKSRKPATVPDQLPSPPPAATPTQPTAIPAQEWYAVADRSQLEPTQAANPFGSLLQTTPAATNTTATGGEKSIIVVFLLELRPRKP